MPSRLLSSVPPRFPDPIGVIQENKFVKIIIPLSQSCCLSDFCIFTVVIKINAYENETVIVELGGHCRSVRTQSVRYTMDGPFR